MSKASTGGTDEPSVIWGLSNIGEVINKDRKSLANWIAADHPICSVICRDDATGYYFCRRSELLAWLDDQRLRKRKRRPSKRAKGKRRAS